MTTIATMLTLTPLAKTVLLHLRKRGSITRMEAQMAYGTPHVGDAIYRLRQAGFNVRTEVKVDEGGHRYPKYSLKQETVH